MGRAQYKVKGGKLLKVQLSQTGFKISKVKITGDFFLHPEALIEELEETLLGQPLDEAKLAAFIESFLSKRNAIMLGVSPADFAKCIVMAVEKDA
jgi:lipoate-protein ligase A